MSAFIADKLNMEEEFRAFLHQDMLRAYGFNSCARAVNLAGWGVRIRCYERTRKVFADDAYSVFAEKYTKKSGIREWYK